MSKSNSLFNYFKKVDTPDKKTIVKENKENESANVSMSEEVSLFVLL
jgi:hypothetical protein